MTRWQQMIDVRKAVLEVLKAHRKGLTAEDIVEAVKERDPDLNADLFDIRDALVRLAVRNEALYPQQGAVKPARKQTVVAH